MKKKKTRSKNQLSSKTLVIKQLENISKLIFSKYFKQITDIVGNSPGVYALYDGSELYYVGKSSDLRKRVKRHLKDRHLASWTHFSLYLVRNAEHIHEIESLIIRISNPKGNRLVPKRNKGETLLNQLKSMIKEKQKEELNLMFGGASKKRKTKKVSSKAPKTLEGLVSKNTPLFKTYKGKDYKAILMSTGKIKLKNKIYYTPTAAALTIVKRKAVNGWNFWFIKDMNGEWVKLSTLRENNL